MEKWHFEICNQTRNAYIKKWGIDSYWKTVLHSIRFRKLDEAQYLVSNQDTGYLAEPARTKEHIELNKSMKIPSFWSLVRQNTIVLLQRFIHGFSGLYAPFLCFLSFLMFLENMDFLQPQICLKNT